MWNHQTSPPTETLVPYSAYIERSRRKGDGVQAAGGWRPDSPCGPDALGYGGRIPHRHRWKQDAHVSLLPSVLCPSSPAQRWSSVLAVSFDLLAGNKAAALPGPMFGSCLVGCGCLPAHRLNIGRFAGAARVHRKHR